MGKGGSSQTIGYSYFMSLHMGLGRGPIDEIVSIKIGDKVAWPKAEGSSEAASTPVTDDTVTQVRASELFGGKKAEGGVEGSLTVCMGKPTQIFPAWVKAKMGGRVPDFRGVATVVFDGMVCMLNPYPKAWRFRVRRSTKGWDGAVWQPGLVKILMASNTIHAMNPAHILYECATNRDWGRGLPRTRIDEASWLKAAQTLYNEKFGMCLRWNRQDELDVFVKDVIDHIGGAIYTDRQTGLLTISLIRDDYDLEDLPLYDYNSGLISIEPEAISRDSAVNEVIVKFHDPVSDEDREVRAQNLASIQSLDSRNSTTKTYAGIPTLDLASRVAQRDLKATSAGNKRYTVILDRAGWKLFPGAVIRVSAPDKGIQNAVLRVGTFEDGPLIDGQIKISALLDVFGLSETAFVDEEVGGWLPPDPTPVIVVNRIIREATYVDMLRATSPADMALVTDSEGYIATVAARPSQSSLNYLIESKVGAEAYVQRGAESWAPFIKLSETLSHYGTSLTFDEALDIGIAEIGSLMQMGNEIVRVDAIVMNEDLLSGSMTITRGCVDTIPAAHAINTNAYFLDDSTGQDDREYAPGETANVKLLSTTSSAVLDVALALTDNVLIRARQGKPYPPGRVRVDDTPCFNSPSVTGGFSITWTHRDRKLQQDQIVGHEESSIGPEDDVRYNLRFYAGSTLLQSITNIAGTGLTYTDSDIAGDLRVELEATRDGNLSFFKYDFPMHREL